MKSIIIYGGTSLLSIEFIKKNKNDIDKFIVIVRNKKKLEKKIIFFEDKLKNKIDIHEIDLLDLKNNLEFSRTLETNSLDGIFFVMGDTGDPELEIENFEKCNSNYKINLIHPILIINSLLSKLKQDSYICVFSSVAGIRGRALRLFYCSAKAGLISYLSGLRQKLYNRNINVINVIAGYMDTEKFDYNVNKFLISKPDDVINRINYGIKCKKETIYSSYIWFVISVVIRLIPEKIFKKLKF
ncbi:SDR family NAD(P)-dependent oxidoreductase [Candidatus Pelagibacter sp.]|uniref:SDR family NAD(P)-dependent oxidoreductase n=1 Tax=Candidatus Pelagibacter sp. TaxID=2024849 RepID=UPI003F82E9FF